MIPIPNSILIYIYTIYLHDLSQSLHRRRILLVIILFRDSYD